MSRNKKLSIIAAVIIVSYSLTGFLLIPYFIKKILPEKLSEVLHRPVEIRNVSVNPYTLTMSFEGFTVMEKKGPQIFLSFDKLLVNIQASSLFRLGLVVKEISLDTPVISISRITDKTFNFSDLLEKPDKETMEAPEAMQAAPLPFSISNIRITGGQITLEDQVNQKKHSISNLSFSLPFLSNFEKYIQTDTKPGLKFQLDDTQITADATAKPFTSSRETTLVLNISGINLPQYFEYLPVDPGFTITSGRLDIHSNVYFTQQKNNPLLLKVSGALALSDLELVNPDKSPLCKLEKMDLELAPSRVLEREIHLKKVAVTKPEIAIQRNASGEINLPALGRPSGSSADQAVAASPQESSQPSVPVRLRLDDLAINSAWIRMQDNYVSESSAQALPRPVESNLGPLQIHVANFSTLPDQKSDFQFRTQINSKGDMEANGQFGISPILVNAQFAFRDIHFSWIEPYLQDTFDLAITSGRFSSSGNVTVTTDEKEELTAVLQGDAAVEDLKTADKIKGESFLELDGLFLKQVDVAVNPTRIALGEIVIQGLSNRIIIYEDGTLNLNKIMLAKAAPESPPQTTENETPPSDSPAAPITIKQVTLKDIQIRFLDQQIQPSFSTNIKLTKGGIAGLTSENFKAADVSIHGSIDDYAPLEIAGKINPLQESLYADIKVRLKDMELSPLTPYAGKFIGKAIEKGKLSLDLEYQIENNNLSAQDKVLFDQLSMGRDMESPEPLNLPIELVISILQDRRGQINLDIPVSGRLDDPEFSLQNVILQTFVNIMEKAATSPFTVIAGIAGGGAELQFIEFDPGMAQLNDTARQKLDSIVTVLYERPGLKLGLTGYVDDQQDNLRLHDMMFEQKIKARKRSALIQDGLSPAPLDQITVNADEYPTYLKLAYLAETSSEPDKDTSPESMEAQIREKIIITDSELRLLAHNRAKSVKAYILHDKRIEPGRLFLSEAANLSPEHKDQYAAGRVQLSLQ